MPARPIFPRNDNDFEHAPEKYYELRKDRWPPAQRCEFLKASGERCRRFASRTGKWCARHQVAPNYAKARKREVSEMQSAQEITTEARELARIVYRDLRVAAPDAVRVLVDLALNEDVAPAVRLKAASELVRHSGMSLERSGDVNLTVSVNTTDASDIVRARLDRLAATSLVIAGELDHAP